VAAKCLYYPENTVVLIGWGLVRTNTKEWCFLDFCCYLLLSVCFTHWTFYC